MARKIRVVIAKAGLDGHDRGAKIVARALRDAGHEVIYTGLHQTPEQIVEGLRAEGLEDVLVLVGGTIPKPDVAALKEQGVAEIFTPGAPVSDIVDFLQAKIPVGA